MSGPSVARLKEKSHIFKLLDDSGVGRFLKIAIERDYAVGEIMMMEGQAGDEFFVLESGDVDIFVDADGERKQVATLSAGACIGEIGAVAMEPRAATVVASTAVRAYAFPAKQTREILGDYPSVREFVIKVALKRSEENLGAVLSGDG